MRIEVSPFAHPSHRSQLSHAELIPHSRALMQGETNKDCAEISLAILILSGKGPQKLQSVFNESLKDRLAQFTKLNPEFEFKRCGRKMAGTPTDVKIIPKPGTLASKKKAKPAPKTKPKPKAKPKSKPAPKSEPVTAPAA